MNYHLTTYRVYSEKVENTFKNDIMISILGYIHVVNQPLRTIIKSLFMLKMVILVFLTILTCLGILLIFRTRQ